MKISIVEESLAMLLQKRIGWDIDLVAVLINGPATFTESELKTAWKLTEPENSASILTESSQNSLFSPFSVQIQ